MKIGLSEARWLTVCFHTKPMTAGTVTIAVFEDTCGNLIQMYQV